MSLKTQARVLRVLEDQRFYPVGSQRPTEVDTRVPGGDQQGSGEADRNRPVPGGSLFPAQRHPLRSPAAKGAQAGHSTASELLHGDAQPPSWQTGKGHSSRGPASASPVSLAGKRPRTPQHGRALDYHGSRCPGGACGPSPVHPGRSRRLPAGGPELAGSPRGVRVRFPDPKATGIWRQHFQNRHRDRDGAAATCTGNSRPTASASASHAESAGAAREFRKRPGEGV